MDHRGRVYGFGANSSSQLGFVSLSSNKVSVSHSERGCKDKGSYKEGERGEGTRVRKQREEERKESESEEEETITLMVGDGELGHSSPRIRQNGSSIKNENRDNSAAQPTRARGESLSAYILEDDEREGTCVFAPTLITALNGEADLLPL